MLVAVVIAGLAAWAQFGGASEYNAELQVGFIAGGVALATIIVTAVLYFFTPINQTKNATVLSVTLVLVAALLAVHDTGGLESPLLMVVVGILPFMAYFGALGIALGFASVAGLVSFEYITNQVLPSQLFALSITLGVPLIAGVLLWLQSSQPKKETEKERSYNELASELSQVAGKSEVVINAISEGVLALDGQGVIQLINPAAQQLIGWQKHDAINLSYKSVLKIINAKNELVSESEDPVAKVLGSNKHLMTDQLSIQTNSGKNFMASISVSPVGQLGNGVIIVFHDVTNEKSDERQRAEFISTASHEMRTPVAAIEGYLGLALNPNTAQIDEKARDFINKAHEAAQHLGHLFSDLLDVSKADDGRLKNDPSVIAVVPFINELVIGLTPKATDKGLRITYKPMPDGDNEESRRINPVYFANVDRDHLREVTDNLIENAIKYTPKGDVVVDVGGDDTHVIISITDTGIGIPKEDQAHLFQKFYRVDNSDTREIGGTGLGLYLCRRLVETMGGRIWVDSEYKKGSTFNVELPRLDHDEATRLIEQASIRAEQQAASEAAEANNDAALKRQQQVQQMTATPVFAPAPTPQPAATQPPVTVQSPQYVVAQTPTPQYQQPTAAPAPQSTPGVTQAPILTPTARQPVNTPISAIESNPSQYLTRPDSQGISVPPRQQ
jgi:PAS domain S-box-containing protein